MPAKNLWLTEASLLDLATLVERWGGSPSAAIRRSMKAAVGESPATLPVGSAETTDSTASVRERAAEMDAHPSQEATE